MPETPPAEPQNSRPLVFALAGILLLIALAVLYFHRLQSETLHADARNQVEAIADLKVQRIVRWRREQLQCAEAVRNAKPALLALARTVQGQATAAERRAVEDWVKKLRLTWDFTGGALVDSSGNAVLLSGSLPWSPAHSREILEASGGAVMLTDFHRESPEAPVHLALSVPLRLSDVSPVFGALIFGIDPARHLFPLLQSWPVPSRTAETLLIRREGEEVVFLNELRHARDIALRMRLPLSMTQVPAVRAALGVEGVMQGVDYRGAKVLAVMKSLPDTPWRMVVEVDQDELNAPLRARTFLLATAGAGFAAALSVLLLFFRRRQQLEFLERQYKAEREHRLLQERFDLLRRGANDIILLLDDEGHIIEANDRAVETYGYTLQELLAMQIRDLRHPDDLENFPDQWTRSGQAGAYLFETVHKRKDGSPIPVEVSVRSLEIDGRIYRQSIIRNISERKAAERERLLLSDAIAASVNEIYLLDPETLKFRYVNAGALRNLGYSFAEMAEMTPLDLTAEFTPESLRALIAPLLAGEMSTRAFETIHRRKDGSLYPVDVRLQLIDHGGERVLLAIILDITERKRMEQERDKLEQQLLQSQKLESIGRLAGGVAHDFNNHLTVIGGYSSLLLRRLPEGDPAREAVQEIQKAGERAAALTRQLLAFSRRQVMEPKPVSLNAVVADTEKMLRRLIGEDVALVTELDPDLGSVSADPNQLAQVLMNLAVNARDAMPSGGRLIIETRNVDLDESYAARHPEVKPGRYALLSVSDTGIGMSKETMEHIFEPFFTTKPQGTGTGLGLATVYGIVRQMGGWIWVYSELGKGSTFRIYFPLAQSPAIALSDDSEPPSLHGNETILVVEDDEQLRHLIVEVLGGYGYQVLAAANGEDALSMAAQQEAFIDLLITDVVMPGMTGRELSRRLADLRPHLQVLYISGYTANVIAHQGILDPGVEYLPKPFTPVQLAVKVRQVLGRAGS